MLLDAQNRIHVAPPQPNEENIIILSSGSEDIPFIPICKCVVDTKRDPISNNHQKMNIQKKISKDQGIPIGPGDILGGNPLPAIVTNSGQNPGFSLGLVSEINKPYKDFFNWSQLKVKSKLVMRGLSPDRLTDTKDTKKRKMRSRARKRNYLKKKRAKDAHLKALVCQP